MECDQLTFFYRELFAVFAHYCSKSYESNLLFSGLFWVNYCASKHLHSLLCYSSKLGSTCLILKLLFCLELYFGLEVFIYTINKNLFLLESCEDY